MNKLFALLTLMCTGCALKQNGNPPPVQKFETLSSEQSLVAKMNEHGEMIIQNYDYIGPAMWIAILLGSVFLIAGTVSFISRK